MSAAMFKAVVWKEIRAILKWAIFALLLLGGWLVLKLGLPGDTIRLEIQNFNRFSRLIDDIEGAAALGGALAGLLLGAVQAIAENRGDKWSFLVHRPVNRSLLFWGKVAAGMLLYAFSTSLPVAGALLRVAALDDLPVRFDWRIALPVFANLLCGVVFYFAGFLTVMRRARWYSTRGLGISAALVCLGLQAGTATTFGQAIAICTAGLVIVGVAAWSTFVAGGEYASQPRVGRAATGLTMGIGLALPGLLALIVLSDLLEPRSEPAFNAGVITSHVVTGDGRFVRITIEGARIIDITDLDGQQLHHVPDSRGTLGAGVLNARFWSQPASGPAFQSIRRLFTPLRGPGFNDPLSWYFSQRQGLVAAYDPRSRELVGWLGPDGFSAGGTRPRAFTGRLNKHLISGEEYLLLFGDAVYRADLDQRRVEKVFEPEQSETLLDVAILGPSARARVTSAELKEFEAIWTTRRLILLHRDGTQVFEAPDAGGVHRYPALQVSRAQQAPGVPTFLWYQGNPALADRVVEFDSAGAVVSTRTLPQGFRPLEEPRFDTFVMIKSALVPPVLQALPGLLERTTPPRSAFSLSRRVTATHWGVAILSLLLSATAVFLRGRAHAFSTGRLLAWTAITLLLGPLGYLMMLGLIDWPARESCPSCRRKRVVTREKCEHCGALFAAPGQDGTEIFEPASPAA